MSSWPTFSKLLECPETNVRIPDFGPPKVLIGCKIEMPLGGRIHPSLDLDNVDKAWDELMTIVSTIISPLEPLLELLDLLTGIDPGDIQEFIDAVKDLIANLIGWPYVAALDALTILVNKINAVMSKIQRIAATITETIEDIRQLLAGKERFCAALDTDVNVGDYFAVVKSINENFKEGNLFQLQDYNSQRFEVKIDNTTVLTDPDRTQVHFLKPSPNNYTAANGSGCVVFVNPRLAETMEKIQDSLDEIEEDVNERMKTLGHLVEMFNKIMTFGNITVDLSGLDQLPPLCLPFVDIPDLTIPPFPTIDFPDFDGLPDLCPQQSKDYPWLLGTLKGPFDIIENSILELMVDTNRDDEKQQWQITRFGFPNTYERDGVWHIVLEASQLAQTLETVFDGIKADAETGYLKIFSLTKLKNGGSIQVRGIDMPEQIGFKVGTAAPIKITIPRDPEPPFRAFAYPPVKSEEEAQDL